MEPQFIIVTEYRTSIGDWARAESVFYTWNECREAIEACESPHELVWAARLNPNYTWEDITDDARDFIEAVLEDAADMRAHYRTEASCNALHGAR